jgi:pimeloyl-ACP methyl ester carboxylesterase/class 3 adenylate cyclase
MHDVDVPETQYARSGDVWIAYQVVGDGPADLVFAPGYVSNLELGWSIPGRAAFLEELASFARVIQFDKRGTGMSDPAREHASLETRMDDVRAVMDAARSERATLFGVDTGGMMSIVFAATYPERTSGLVLSGTAARTLWAPDHPWGPTETEYLRSLEHEERRWGSPEHGLEVMRRYSPSLDDDSAEPWAAYMRQSASPGAYAAYRRMNMENDVRGVLPAIHVRTLVAHRAGDEVVPADAGRYLADHIAGARFVELPGADHSPFTGSTKELIAETRRFITEAPREPGWEDAGPDRVLATVLFTDIVESTATAAELGDAGWRELIREHNSVIRRLLARYRGNEVDTSGDGFFASFDGPARAIRCAQAIREAVEPLGVQLRTGLHTGECELLDGKVGGIAVHIGARVAEAAGPGEVLVSSTVKDLVAGSGLEFEDRGSAELKGVPGEWRLYAVAD